MPFRYPSLRDRIPNLLLRLELLANLHQLVLQVLNLLLHGPTARSTRGITTLDGRLKVEDVLDVLGEMRRDGLELLESEVREGDGGLLGEADAGAGDVVGLAEGDLWLEKIGGGGERM